MLRRVWARHFERVAPGSGDDAAGGGGDQATGRVRLRPAQGRGPGDRVESPYDPEAHFRAKSGTGWIGYMVHLTETCDAGAPRLVVHAEAAPANVHEAMRAEAIHDALAAKGLAPSEHLVDAGHASGHHIVAARERHGIELVGPPRPDLSWQGREEGAFRTADFAVDWESRRARCPEGRTSTTWGEYTDGVSGQSCLRVGFSPADCRPCSSRSRCTRAASRQLGLLPRPEHEAVAAARARMETETGRRLYDQRRGVEGTISQGVRAFGLRRARYRGLPKTNLQSVVTAAAMNLDRLAAWFAKRPRAPRASPPSQRSTDFANSVRRASWRACCAWPDWTGRCRTSRRCAAGRRPWRFSCPTGAATSRCTCWSTMRRERATGSSAAPNGIKVREEGDWHARKHGGAKRRVWRKVPLGIDETTMEVRAVEVTGRHVGDAPVLP